MSIRLNKVSKEFNLSLKEIAFFLKERCKIKITSLNESISEVQYFMIKRHFTKNKVYHDAIHKMQSSNNKNETELSEEEKAVINDFNGDAQPLEQIKAKNIAKRKKYRYDKKYKKTKSGNWLSEFKGSISIISVPFGGMKK